MPRAPAITRSLMVATLAIISGAVFAQETPPTVIPPPKLDSASVASGHQKALLAGGCYWGTQGIFEHVKGITRVVAGFTAGYSDDDGGVESVMITFDPRVISYGKLLQIFFSVVHDPTELDRQGPDVGPGYRSAIFYLNDDQRRIADAYVAQLDRAKLFPKKIVTSLAPYSRDFHPVGIDQQDFMAKNPQSEYIIGNDLPKLGNLKRLFPAFYRGIPLEYQE